MKPNRLDARQNYYIQLEILVLNILIFACNCPERTKLRMQNNKLIPRQCDQGCLIYIQYRSAMKQSH